MSRFAVIQEAFEPPDADQLAPLLQRALGLVPYDALRQAREARGILAEGVERGPAEALAAALVTAGAPARVVAQERVLRIGKPQLVRTIAFGEKALAWQAGYTGAMTEVAWERIRLLSAGRIPEVRVTRAAAPRRKRRGLSLGGMLAEFAAPGIGGVLHSMLTRKGEAKGTGKARSETTLQPLADLFAMEPDGGFLHVRLRGRDLYYDRILGAERTGHFMDDFLRVVARLATRSTRAVVTPGVRALVAAAEDPAAADAEADFAAEEEFTQVNRWQLQMLALAGADDTRS